VTEFHVDNGNSIHHDNLKSREAIMKIQAMVLLIAVAGLVIGCGPSQQEWEATLQELENAKAEAADLKKQLDDRIGALEAENADLRDQLDGFDEKYANQKELLEQLKKQEALAKERLKIISDMLSKFESLIKAGKLKVKIRDGKMLLELPSAVLFKSGESNLSKDGEKTLAEVAPVLASIKNREFQVAGHTDNQPIKKSEFESNWELSVARALKVVTFLEKSGVKPKNLSVAGYSQYQPVADNSGPKGKAANRRIEIVVMPDLDELPDMKELEKMVAEDGG
jgi:chemotaxis protein MotB